MEENITIEKKIKTITKEIERLDLKWINHENEHFNLKTLLEKIHIDYKALENKQRYYGEFNQRINELEKKVKKTFDDYYAKLKELSESQSQINPKVEIIYGYIENKINQENEELRNIKKNKWIDYCKVIIMFILFIFSIVGSLKIGLDSMSNKFDMFKTSISNDLKEYKKELKEFNEDRYNLMQGYIQKRQNQK